MDILNSDSHKIYYGSIIDKNKIIDEVLVSIFKGKNLLQEKKVLKYPVMDQFLFKIKSYNF